MKPRTPRGAKMQGGADPRRALRLPAKDADKAAQAQLERVLASVTFRQVDRLKRFLNFIVSEALAGRGDQLKEYVIGVQVFDKDSSFDPRADPIVRVQARRLRARLVRYYREEGGTDALVIELPKGGYTPVFKNREASGSSRRSLGTTLAGQNTIAVLPFADHSPAKELAYFCDGLHQEIIHSLAKFEALRVLAVQPGGGLAAGIRPRVRRAGRAAPDRRRPQVRRSRARHGPPRRHAERVVPLVRVGRRRRSTTCSPRRNRWPKRSSTSSSRG